MKAENVSFQTAPRSSKPIGIRHVNAVLQFATGVTTMRGPRKWVYDPRIFYILCPTTPTTIGHGLLLALNERSEIASSNPVPPLPPALISQRCIPILQHNVLFIHNVQQKF